MTELLQGDIGLWMLFSTGFLSATLLPGGSEVNLIAAIAEGNHPAWQILVAVTVGNTLGGVTNYGLGRFLPTRKLQGRQIHRAKRWVNHYGVWGLLFSWLPIIGDPMCLVAGWLRLNFGWCCVAIFIGKALRYGAIFAMFNNG